MIMQITRVIDKAARHILEIVFILLASKLSFYMSVPTLKPIHYPLLYHYLEI